MAGHLKDKVIVVTGGGSGIGKTLTIAFAAEGAKVSVCGRTRQTLEETAAQIRAESGEVFAVRCDVSDAQAVDSDSADDAAFRPYRRHCPFCCPA